MRSNPGYIIASIGILLAIARAVAIPTLLPPRDDAAAATNISTIIFDAPAFRSSADDIWKASIRSYVYETRANISGIVSDFEDLLNTFGVDIGDRVTTLTERVRLFGSDGIEGEEVVVGVGGCDDTSGIEMEATAGSPDDGMMERNVTLGACAPASLATGVNGGLIGQVVTTEDGESVGTFTVFPAEAAGWGLISDIDDTIKVSNVLDTSKAFEAAFLDPPVAVNGMPEVYAALHDSFTDPQFIYLSGSPWQLYPMLHDFIDTTYPAGPILLQNLTFTDMISLVSFVAGSVEDYKVTQIDKIHSWYPSGKKFLGVGDSTQSDPEVYGDSFRKYGAEFIPCIWIRMVDGADNSDDRFADAFEGVPESNWRTFTNASELVGIDVAGGEC